MLKRFQGPRGQVERLTHQSRCLEGNALGDPATRRLDVYLPAAYKEQPKRRFPVLFDIVGYTGSGFSHTNWRNFTENVPERADRLIANGDMPPCIVVFPNCFTALGGNQYIDSSAIGPYAEYLTQELVPFVDEQFRTLEGREHRGLFGKSSGGYGAIIHAMRYAETWSAAACHSGDMYFELCYLSEAPKALNRLAKCEGSVEAFLEDFHKNPKPTEEDTHTLMFLAMAASYDPDPSEPLGFHLPVDIHTCELNFERWAQWQKHDPVNLVEACKDNLMSMKCLYIDCGSVDQYHLHFGSRVLHRKLEEAGVPHIYEEFDDNHSGIDYRMDRSLPLLVKALMGE